MKNTLKLAAYVAATLSVLGAFVAALSFAQDEAPPVTALTFTTNFTGTPNVGDVRGAKYAVTNENLRRTGTAEPLLPVATPAELKESYLTLANAVVLNFHQANVKAEAEVSRPKDIATLWRDATDAQRAAALDALTP